MKKIIVSSLLILVFIFTQAVYAKDQSSGALSSLMDPSASSGQMSDDEIKILGEVTHEMYVENIVSVYQKGLLKGLKSEEDRTTHLLEQYSIASEVFGLCALIAATESYDYKSPILEKHLVYFTRAFARLVDDLELEENSIEQRKNYYDVSLANMKKELAGVSSEHKARHKEWKKLCRITLKHAVELNNAAKNQRDDAAIKSRVIERLKAIER